MVMKFFGKHWPHVVAWVLLLIYLHFAPALFALAFVDHGRPIQSTNDVPAESDQITFVIEGLDSDGKDGEGLHTLYGWALMRWEDDTPRDPWIREVVLISDERKYFFPAGSVYRNPELPDGFADTAVDLESLGFNALIAADTIKAGKYRIGIVFRDPQTGSSYYWDKPATYLLKTPNKLRLEAK